MRNRTPAAAGLILAALIASSHSAFAQTPRESSRQTGSETTAGTVFSVSRNTLIVRTSDGQHHVFLLERDTTKPAKLAPGQQVRVVSRADGGDRVARTIQVTAEAPQGAAAQAGEPVPEEVRTVERQIERQMRRYQAGVRFGVGLDPEILMGGLHARLGPFFHRDVWFRPNAQVGWGEVTTMFDINLEAIYRLPVNSRSGRWLVYVGAGPGLNFIDRSFEEAETGERDIDFDDFDYETSLNILAGVENRNGMFLEVKSTAYSRPNVKLLVGYSF